MGKIVDAFSSGGSDPAYTPNPESYEYPRADELAVRFFAILDNYIKERGIDALIPKSNRPYEYLSPTEQAGIREEVVHQAGLPEDEFRPPVPWTPGYASYVPLTQVEEETGEIKPEEKAEEAKPAEPVEPPKPERQSRSTESTDDGLDKDYSDAALAASLTAQRLGIGNERPLFTAPQEFYEQDDEQKKAALQEVTNFIYGGQKIGF
jgi:hypothetical protein